MKRREKILVSGGLDHGQGLDQHQVLDSLLEFCPQQETWREVSRMPRPRADHAMVLYDDMVYFVGGWRDSGEGRVLIPEVDRCAGVKMARNPKFNFFPGTTWWRTGGVWRPVCPLQGSTLG